MRPSATDQWLAKGKDELGRVLRAPPLSLVFVYTVCVYECVLGRGEYTSFKSVCVVINFYLKPKILLTLSLTLEKLLLCTSVSQAGKWGF